jgi:hypothetical protein
VAEQNYGSLAVEGGGRSALFLYGREVKRELLSPFVAFYRRRGRGRCGHGVTDLTEPPPGMWCGDSIALPGGVRSQA